VFTTASYHSLLTYDVPQASGKADTSLHTVLPKVLKSGRMKPMWRRFLVRLFSGIERSSRDIFFC
jgi:hypothetical protein